jgi:predicted acylesterase/phospholipase RssA
VHAIEECLDGVHLSDLHVYVGVSAGSVIASALANGITPARMCRIFVQNESSAFPLNPERFLQPAFKEYLRRFGKLPGLLQDTVRRLARLPRGHNLLQELSGLAAVLPTGIFSNNAVDAFLSEVFSSRGCSNDFRELRRRLYVVATRLDTGESVRFGAPGYDHIPVSRAVQASTALPGFYPPVEIHGDYYVDGALQKTLHASVALDEGADLLLCINPIVPVDARLAGSDEHASHEKLIEGGLPMVLSQTLRALVHSRMQLGMSQYREKYPDSDVVLFEPDPGDARMFFTNVFSFANRRRVCEHAYQTTRRDLAARRAELEPLFARHGISLRTEMLEDADLHFDTNLRVSDLTEQLGMRRNRVTNRLSGTLDQLETWLDTADS